VKEQAYFMKASLEKVPFIDESLGPTQRCPEIFISPT